MPKVTNARKTASSRDVRLERRRRQRQSPPPPSAPEPGAEPVAGTSSSAGARSGSREDGKKKRKIRMTMTKKHMNLMLKAVYYAEGEISLKNKRIWCMVASMFYCLKRFNDISI